MFQTFSLSDVLTVLPEQHSAVLDWERSYHFVCGDSWVFCVVFNLMFGEGGVLSGIVGGWLPLMLRSDLVNSILASQSEELSDLAMDTPIIIFHQE